jgi:hypothetical protein
MPLNRSARLATPILFLLLAAWVGGSSWLPAQSADWRQGVWHEPQVRYLIADLCLGGNARMYRQYGEEGDPDSHEAIRLWDAGARVVNTNDFERKWIACAAAKDGKVMRIVFRGTDRTINGTEIVLSSDLALDQGRVRLALLGLSLGVPAARYERLKDLNAVEALRRWAGGVRVLNTNLFELRGGSGAPELRFRQSHYKADGAFVRLNSDTPYSELNVRYFMADIALGGSVDFYRVAAEAAHETGCLEAVRRTEQGYRITNLDQFERKKVDGQTVITRKNSDQRISGRDVQLSSD